MLDIKEYLKQTKTVLLTQDAFDELMQRACASLKITVDGYADGFADGYKQGLKDAQPTIKERKRGAWTDNNACPFCEYQPWYERDIHTLSYCPNCGADMRGEQNG